MTCITLIQVLKEAFLHDVDNLAPFTLERLRARRLRAQRKEPSHWRGASYACLLVVNSTFHSTFQLGSLNLLPGLQCLDDALMVSMWNYYGKLLVILDKISVLSYLHEVV